MWGWLVIRIRVSDIRADLRPEGFSCRQGGAELAVRLLVGVPAGNIRSQQRVEHGGEGTGRISG
ncbi:hypothetical protein D7D52_33130 [Nocardia yunnanensis]|uniref:Uncharacterized protein n=1 Tax=Nocardia yunnanensis TaxID=2382165 RepID=A0A386ZKB4_9NOCA|nr:hypothetical protein D7D52_33130 [Nocardia yunnanensis]